jgi:hypothetical protein
MSTKEALFRFLKGRRKPQRTAEQFITELEKLGHERQGIINITEPQQEDAEPVPDHHVAVAR